MALPPERLDRFARHIVLPEVGGAGQAALASARVVLIGLGGIGSPALQYLAGAGIGTLVLVDDDTCAEDGMLGAMSGWTGTFAALQAIRVLLAPAGGMGDAQWGKLHLLDGLKPGMRTLSIAKDPACRACGTG